MRTVTFCAVAALVIVLADPATLRAGERYTYVTQWAVSNGGVFSLDVDRFGDVYIANQLEDLIQKFSSTGVLLTQWGTYGSGPGQFYRPNAVSVDSVGNVYVADRQNARIEKFTNTGGYLGEWGHLGTGPGEFRAPEGVAADRFGHVYVQDELNLRVQKFSDVGVYLGEWSVGGIGDVAVDRDGNIFASTYDNHVIKYSPSGAFLTQWGSTGSAPGQFDGLEGLAVDDSGNVYVTDVWNHRIQKFRGDGTFVTEFGGEGEGQGQFYIPMDVAVDDGGAVYVSDAGNLRIQKFEPAPPVLLVHGFCGEASSWETFVQVLSESGFDVHTIQYGTTEYSDPPDVYVPRLAAKLDSMGADRVAIVAHSMGGLIAREYMRRQVLIGQPNPIVQLVTLGTPHHGNDAGPVLLEFRNALDLGCKLHLPGYPCDSVSRKLKNFLGCQGDRRTVKALVDMSPGSAFLNRLNYGIQTAFFDAPGKKGWDTHQPETNLTLGTYYASIGGTATICGLGQIPIWGVRPAYHENDGVIATGSAMLTHSQTFRSRDIDLPMGRLTHASTPPFLCERPYYSSDTLARKVAKILGASPASPPVPALATAREFRLAGEEAIVEDSLRIIPAIMDTISAGLMALPSVTVPATTLMLVTLVSDDARLTLQAPNGAIITPNDTSSVNGVEYFGFVGDGFEGYRITTPLPGAWTLRVDATASAASQQYGCVVSYAASADVRLWTTSPVIYAGDSLRVRGQVSDGGGIRTDIGWTCRMIDPDGVATELSLYDDGIHGDSLSGDGIFGNVRAPAAELGQYQILAAATVPGYGTFAAGAICEFAHYDDLAVAAEDVLFSPNSFDTGDSVTVLATIHNGGSRAALGVHVAFYDRRVGVLLGGSTVDIASGSTVMVEAGWRAAAPDTHDIQVVVSPYVFESEASYTNNAAERTVVLGTPASVGPEGPTMGILWLAPPRPNPSTRAVSLAFRLPNRGDATLEVFDVLGRRVRRWIWGGLAAGPHSVEWDGRNENGSVVTPGVLLCRLKASGQLRSRKLVFLP